MRNKEKIKIIGLSGSLKSNFFNTNILRIMGEMLNADVDFLQLKWK